MSGLIPSRNLPPDSSSYNLSPWQQQNKIPQKYLNSAITPSFKYKSNTFAPSLTRMRDFKPKILQKRPFTFKSNPILNGNKNLGYLECIQYSWIDPKIDIGEGTQKEREKKNIIIARRRTRKGLQIKSIKKKIVDSSELAIKSYPFFEQSAQFKQRIRFITESKLNTSILIQPHESELSIFSKSHNKKRSKKGLNSHLSRQFLTQISTIATISNQKRTTTPNKCRTEQPSPTQKDWLIQRNLFLQTNSKFKDWQRGTNKTIAYSISLPIS